MVRAICDGFGAGRDGYFVSGGDSGRDHCLGTGRLSRHCLGHSRSMNLRRAARSADKQIVTVIRETEGAHAPGGNGCEGPRENEWMKKELHCVGELPEERT